MRTSARLLVVTMLAVCASLFAAAASAKSQTFNISSNGDPFATTVTQRQTALINYIGAHGLMPSLANGDTVVVNWTGGTQVWRSVWSVAFYGSALSLSETKGPELAYLRYSFADQQRYCQGSYMQVTLTGYWQSWQITINGQIANSGTEFVTTGYTATGVSLCYQNI